MTAITVSLLVFAVLVAGGLVGMALRRVLPEHHFSHDSKEVVKLGSGLIGTMAALLLGLLVASAKSSYDAKRDELTQIAAKVSFMDQVLANYGSEAGPAREVLRSAVTKAMNALWPGDDSSRVQFDPAASTGKLLQSELYGALYRLSPKGDEQTALKAQALTTAIEIGQTRWLLLAQQESSISTPMLVIVIFWLCAIFVSLGLFAPNNTTVHVTLILCALSVAGAILLMLELDQPYNGLIRIPDTPMRIAMEHLGE